MSKEEPTKYDVELEKIRFRHLTEAKEIELGHKLLMRKARNYYRLAWIPSAFTFGVGAALVILTAIYVLDNAATAKEIFTYILPIATGFSGYYLGQRPPKINANEYNSKKANNK